MAGDPTEVDWDYQIQHKPPLGGAMSVSQINPPAGPFTGSTLTLDHDTGLKALAGPQAILELASLSQMGGIGTNGNQQLQGPLYFVGSLGLAGLPSAATSAFAAMIQDGKLGFYNSTNDGTGNPIQASIDWYSSTPRTLTIFSQQGIQINSNALGGPIQFNMASGGGQFTMGIAGNGITVYDPTDVHLSSGAGPNVHAILSTNLAGTGQWGLALTRTSGTTALAYACNNQVGQTGTLPDGSTVTGGLITTISSGGGTSPTGPAGGDLTGTYPNPVVFRIRGMPVSATVPSPSAVLTWNGVLWQGIVPSGGGATGPAGGDLSGTYPNPTLAKIQGTPVSLSTLSTDDLFYWNGSAWVAGNPPISWTDIIATPTTVAGYGITDAIKSGGAASGDLSGTYPGPTVSGLAGSPLTITSPASGDVVKWSGSAWVNGAVPSPTSIANGGGSVSIDGSGNLSSSIGGNNALSMTAAGALVLGGAGASLSMPATGAFTLASQAGAQINGDTGGSLTLLPTSGGNVQIFSAGASVRARVYGFGLLTWETNVSTGMQLDSSGTWQVNGGTGITQAMSTANDWRVSHSSGTQIEIDGAGDFTLSLGSGRTLGVFGAAGTVQATAGGVTSGFTPNTSANFVYNESTFTGGVGSSAYTLNDIVAALKGYGWLAL